MYLCRELLKLPYIKIGRIFQRDHSTVITSVNNIKKNIESKNPEIVDAILMIKKKFLSISIGNHS